MFLCPTERDTLMALHPAIRSYSRLQLSASVIDVTPLTLPRQPVDAYAHGQLLLELDLQSN